MLTPLLLAAVVAAAPNHAPAAASAPADVVARPFAVCVTLTSDPAHPHLDSFWTERDNACARRREIVREGWVRLSEEEPSEEDESGPLTILKATVEDTTDGGSICVGPAALSADSVGVVHPALLGSGHGPRGGAPSPAR